jgi:hypothetical protein
LPHIGRRSRSERRAFIVAVNDFYFDFKTVSHIGRRSRSERRPFIVAINDFYFDFKTVSHIGRRSRGVKRPVTNQAFSRSTIYPAFVPFMVREMMLP